MDGGLVNMIITGVLGVGAGNLLHVILQGRSVARKVEAETSALNAKTPAEIDSVAIQGAESAVRALQVTNESLVAELARKDVENARLRSQLEQMELKLEQAKGRASAAEGALSAAMDQLRLVQQDYAQITAQLETFRSEAGERQ